MKECWSKIGEMLAYSLLMVVMGVSLAYVNGLCLSLGYNMAAEFVNDVCEMNLPFLPIPVAILGYAICSLAINFKSKESVEIRTGSVGKLLAIWLSKIFTKLLCLLIIYILIQIL